MIIRPYKGPTLAIPNVFLYRLEAAGTHHNQRARLQPNVEAMTGEPYYDSLFILTLRVNPGLKIFGNGPELLLQPAEIFAPPSQHIKRAETCPQP